MNNFLFLTEGSKKFGLGHLSRCSALAKALKTVSKNKMSIQFIVEGDSVAKKMIGSDQAFAVKFTHWHRMGADQIIRLAAKFNTVVIDSYHLPQKHYEQIRPVWRGKLWIVDDDKRLVYENTQIINPSPAGHSLRYKKSNLVLAGKEHVILRPAFWQNKKKAINRKLENVFISLGGGAVDNQLITRLIREIDQLPDITLHLLSAKKVDIRELRADLKQYTYINETVLKALLDKMDLAVSACGQTLYELAQCGVPTIGISIVANQIGNVKSLKSVGFLKYIGEKENFGLEKKLAAVLRYLQPAANRRTYSLAGQKSIDGHGASRIARTILKRTLNESNN
jgi:UDP-2,4-diacetamido-2,4,6-trideoxy-beta-L-altropyranose hydrolase